MRIRLTLRPAHHSLSIPLNYQYYLSAAIYRWIERSSRDYALFLHERGFSPEGMVRSFKHFCFSQLIVPRRKIVDGRMVLESSIVEWFVSMPVEESLQHLVVGMFEKREFYIEQEENRFLIEQVETLPEPEWKETMKFRMLSPTTVSIPEKRHGKLWPCYLLPDDPRLSNALSSNILNKYNSLCRSNFSSTSSVDMNVDLQFQCTLDQQFITDRGGPSKITKLITIKAGHEDETKVRGFMCPITLEGNIELIKLAYESGLGEKNSLGFGMLSL
jgi:CRISPR-associated endoribonuclease Cas6